MTYRPTIERRQTLGEPAEPREASGDGTSGHDMEGYAQRDAALHFLQLVDLRFQQESAPPDTDRLVKLCDVMTCLECDGACETLTACLWRAFASLGGRGMSDRR